MSNSYIQMPPPLHQGKQSQKSGANTVTCSTTYLSSRQVHPDERVIFEGPVKIEDRQKALKGQILLKDRFAVLCPSRLLLFKNERESRKQEAGNALAVYPIAQSDFTLHDAPPLTEANFASIKDFQTQVDSLQNYMVFVRMSFRDGTSGQTSNKMMAENERLPPQSRNHNKRTVGFNETMAITRNKDFYFTHFNQIWLSELLQAKKRLQDMINAQPASALSMQMQQEQFSPIKTRTTTALRAPSQA